MSVSIATLIGINQTLPTIAVVINIMSQFLTCSIIEGCDAKVDERVMDFIEVIVRFAVWCF